MRQARLVGLLAAGCALLALSLCCRYSNAGTKYEVSAERTEDSRTASVKTFRPGLHGVQGQYDLAQDTGAVIQRTFISWQVVEPQKGRYDFTRLDEVAQGAGSRGIDTAVTIRALSEWGSDQSVVQQNQGERDRQAGRRRGKRSRATTTRNSYPDDVDAWLRMMGKLVERYDGDGHEDMPGLTRPIRYWQIENEVSWQWNGPMKSYVDLLRQTREVIRNADPNAKIVLGAITASQYLALEAGLVSDPSIKIMSPNGKSEVSADEVRQSPRFQEMKDRCDDLFSLAGPYFDIADFHSYSDDPQLIPVQAAWMRYIMKKNDCDQPIWCQECGGPITNYSQSAHADQVIKRMAVAFASGVPVVMWSTLAPTMEFGQKYIDISLVDSSEKKKPAFSAYQLMARTFGRCASAERLKSAKNVCLYEFTGNGRYWVAWSTTGKAKVSPVDGVRRIRIYDLASAGGSKPRELTITGKTKSLTVSTRPVVVEAVD